MQTCFPEKLILLTLLIASTLGDPFLEGATGMCADIFVDKGGYKVSTRTMEWYEDQCPVAVVSPRGVYRESYDPESNVAPLNWTAKYGSVSVHIYHLDASTDGLNEAGLSAAILHLDETKYSESEDKPGLSFNYWGQYFLDNFETVSEAINSTDEFFVYWSAPQSTPFEEPYKAHLVLHDATGDSAILEYLNGSLVVYHPLQVDVMTNDPNYGQMLNLSRDYEVFGGSLPFPGDIDPVSRFVRAAFYLDKLPQPNSDEQAVSYAFALIGTVGVPPALGIHVNPHGEYDPDQVWSTIWYTVRDHNRGRFYFRTDDSLYTKYLDLRELDLSEGQPLKALDMKSDQCGDVSQLLKPCRAEDAIIYLNATG